MTPGTSNELELLALLSPTPAPLDLLAKDLGLNHQRDVYLLLRRLESQGYQIKTTLTDQGRAAYIGHAGFKDAYTAAERYVDAA